jgi:putative transposase
MRKSKFTEEHSINILKEADAGTPVADVCRRHGLSVNTFYNWKRKFAGPDVPDAKRLRQVEEENRQLKSIVADQALNINVLKHALETKCDHATSFL